MKEMRIGTRGSPLALWQANWVRESLSKAYPQLRISLVRITTKGDKLVDVSLARVATFSPFPIGRIPGTFSSLRTILPWRNSPAGPKSARRALEEGLSSYPIGLILSWSH